MTDLQIGLLIGFVSFPAVAFMLSALAYWLCGWSRNTQDGHG